MENTQNTQNTQNEDAQNEASNQPEQKDEGFKLQEVDRKYYGPSEVQQAKEEVSRITEGLAAMGINPMFNFEPEEPFPEGYGIAIIPLSKRVPEEGNVNINVAIGAIPDPELIAEKDGGSDWIYSTLTAALIAKVANNARPKADGSSSGSLPFSVQDFITNQRAGENLEAWRKIAPRYVTGLRQKAKGLRGLTLSVLKQILQSTEFAESMYSKIPQSVWVRVLDKIIEHAKEEGLDTAVLEHWKATRDSAEMQEPTIDLEDLDNL